MPTLTDAVGRLTDLTHQIEENTLSAYHYTYNPAGKRTQAVETFAQASSGSLPAQENGGTVWHYVFDGNGSLVESLPGDQPGSGAKRYTYNTAGQLVKVESHDGASYQPQAEMQYNGLGQRLALTAHQGGQSLTTQYVLDGDTLLAATASGQTTYYLSGIGEYQAAWGYYLADGTNSVRQITNVLGVVTLTRSFTPWGELLALSGTGDFTWGYLGGVLDAATGLIYVGNGQYYDPATGRFLSRGVNPGAPNPYVPWQGNPTGMIVGPLALLALIRGRRKAGKFDRFMVVVIMIFAIGLTVSGCDGGGDRETIPQPPSTPTSTPTEPKPDKSGGDGTFAPTATPTSTPTPTPTCTPTATPGTSWEEAYGKKIANAAITVFSNANQYYVWAMADKGDEDISWPPPRKKPEEGAKWGFNQSIDLKERLGTRIPVVCADIVAIAYEGGGLSLTGFSDWYSSSEWSSGDPTRNSYALKTLIERKGKLNVWGDGKRPELGDMVFFKNLSHAGVIVSIDGGGKDDSKIYVVQASYSKGIINKIPLSEWKTENDPVSYGHPWKE